MVQQAHPNSAQRAALADITTGVIQLFRKYYGRGPTKGKTYLMDDSYVLCVLEHTMTTVEETLAKAVEQYVVRNVRLTLQEGLSKEFTGVVEKALGRKVIAYHSQLVTDPDLGFE